jgi:trimeric autotransporter adhesin
MSVLYLGSTVTVAGSVVNLNGGTISNAAEPVNQQDVSTKAYTDSVVSVQEARIDSILSGVNVDLNVLGEIVTYYNSLESAASNGVAHSVATLSSDVAVEKNRAIAAETALNIQLTELFSSINATITANKTEASTEARAAEATFGTQAQTVEANTYTDTSIGFLRTEANTYADSAAATTLALAKAHADESTLIAANAYADSAAASANTYADGAAATTLTSANTYADGAATSALTYADTVAATTLTLANAYTDTALITTIASATASAKAYTDIAALQAEQTRNRLDKLYEYFFKTNSDINPTTFFPQ